MHPGAIEAASTSGEGRDMLKRMELTNFKAWKRLEIDFGRVTGLFGKNSSGKTSLLQFLLLLKQTKNATDRKIVLEFGGPFVDLRTFHDIAHKREESDEPNGREKINWGIRWVVPGEPDTGNAVDVYSAALLPGRDLSMECAVGLKNSSPHVYYLSYESEAAKFGLDPISREYSLKFTRGGTSIERLEAPSPVKTHGFPTMDGSFHEPHLRDLELEYEKLMDRIFHLGPLREPPRSEYRWSRSGPLDVGPRGEYTVEAILSATMNDEKRTFEGKNQPFQVVIAGWLKKLDLIEDFEVKEIAQGSNLYQAVVKREEGSPKVLLSDVGFGISQVLPSLVLLYYVPEGSTVLIEQPEIHLHPAVQSGLADIMLHVAETRDVQVIVESHSEHLVRRLQRRVAEEVASAEDVKLYFASSEQGQAQLSDLRLNEWGNIENWPESFFGDEMEEIAAIAEASLERRIATKSKETAEGS